jgi:hypothetical protein
MRLLPPQQAGNLPARSSLHRQAAPAASQLFRRAHAEHGLEKETAEHVDGSADQPGFAQDLSRIPVQARSPVFVQPKLRVSSPGDSLEQEAERVSNQGMHLPVPQVQPGQGIAGSGESRQSAILPIVQSALRSPGQPLNPQVRALMEPRFGYDFSRVRVHQDTIAGQSARQLAASAYTAGQDIVFAPDQYSPHSSEGRKLIAHELTHVVQQANVASPDTLGMLARRPAPVHPDSVEFRVGVEIKAALASAAKMIAPGGVTVDELKGLRSVALADETIDHEERGFLAGLLDPANAAQVAGGGTSFVFPRSSIDAHLAEAADLERPQWDAAVFDAYKEKWKAVALGTPGDVKKHAGEEENAALAQISRLVGKSREPRLRPVLAFSAAHGVRALQLLTAMLAGASDSTPGDLLMAATVYAVAAAVNHPLQDEILSGRVKVDQVPKANLGVADASYSTEGIGKDKGDTLYVPESLSIDDAAHRSQIIHELEHALQDQGATSGLIRVEAELGAYRAQAGYLLDQIAPLKGAERDTAIKNTARITNAILIRALILESRRNRPVFDMVIVDINSQMPANVQINVHDLAVFIAMNDATLIAETKAAILNEYKIGAGNIGPAGGLLGEHDSSRM